MLIPIAQYLLVMVCCTLLLLGVHELFRRYLKLTIILSLLALLSCPWWFSSLGGAFLGVKTVLMILSIMIITLTRWGYAVEGFPISIPKGALPFWLIYTALVSNIAVALIPDIEIGNYGNAAAGLLLCVTVPLPPAGWTVDIAGKRRDLLVGLPIIWCLLYTSWWLNFLYGGWPGVFSRGICLMAVTFVPLVVYKRHDLWLSTRAYTLAFYMLTITFLDYSVPFIDGVIKQNGSAITIWGMTNLALHTVYAMWWLRNGRMQFRHPAPA